MQFNISGVPIAKRRHRFYMKPGMKGPRAYDDQKKERKKFQIELMAQIKSRPLWSGPIDLDLYFFMPIPSSYSKKKTVDCIDGKIHHLVKPDTDNLIKFVMDCLNGIVWKDDKQVILIRARKKYGDVPQTVCFINEIKS